jgi:hypothetical protein
MKAASHGILTPIGSFGLAPQLLEPVKDHDEFADFRGIALLHEE